MILDQITEAVRKRLVDDKKTVPLTVLKKQALSMAVKMDFPFERALRQPGISCICEVKKASPSKGLIAADFPYRDIAQAYEQAGAAAVSVLTEHDFFQGSPVYLQQIAGLVSIPVLRKDFIVDAYQIYEAKVWGASAILLICAVLSEEELVRFLRLAEQLGLSVLTEAHDEEEIEKALRSGARVIGVNNRNLKDFTVSLETSRRLRQFVPKEVLFVAESGIQTAADVDRLRACGVDAVLIGETLMRRSDKTAALQELLGKA